MTCRPDFSPKTLSDFIRIRMWALECSHTPGETTCSRCRRNYLTQLRKDAQITRLNMRAAVAGRLGLAEPRERLWAVMKYAPADSGIRLLDGGKQESLK